MRLPRRFMPHTVTVEPYEGDGAHGPIYGAPVEVDCLIDESRKVVRNADGVEVVSEVTFFCGVDEQVPPSSKVTVRGRDTYVIASKRQDGGGLPTPDHREVNCA